MNKEQLISIGFNFNLGVAKDEPQSVAGGLLHRMWRVETQRGIFAIKELAKHIDLTNDKIVHNYNLTEGIAFDFIKKGIPAVSAIKSSTNFLLLIDGVGFLVYPWVNAKVFSNDLVSEEHALQIAEILAKMHLIDLKIPQITDATFDIHSDDKIIALAYKAKETECPFALSLNENLQNLLKANSGYKNSIATLKKQSVVSHGDLDQKNVLWDERGKPIIIDWESARKLIQLMKLLIQV